MSCDETMVIAQGVATEAMSMRHQSVRALDAARRQASLGAFWALCEERAERTGAALDRRREAGRRLGPLAGVPLAVKDCFDLQGVPTSAGLAGPHRSATRDAEGVRRLETAGAVAIGKTAMDALGWSTHGEAPERPPCLSPVDPALSPGGSSAGSAAAVAAGITPLALGTDLAGSVRIPAAYCGIVGLKPGSRTVPLQGCLGVAPGFEVPGVLARTVGVCTVAYEVLSRRHVGEAADELRVGLLEDLFEESDRTVAGPCEQAVRELADSARAGRRIEVDGTRLDWRAKGFGRVLAVELGRRWGRHIEAEPERFPPPIRESAERGRATDAASYRQALLALRGAGPRLARRLEGFDALVCPTVPIPVPRRELERVSESTRFTRLFSALGWPAISVPCGRDGKGRPIGLQVTGRRGSLPQVLAVARAIEACAAG